MFDANLNENGETLGSYNGYVPLWFPNPTIEHYGDYVELEIEIDTGKIVGWKKPTEKDLRIFK